MSGAAVDARVTPEELLTMPDGERYERVAGELVERVRLVWVINPEERTATIYRADGSVSWLHETDELDGKDVLPGFRCPLSALFPAAPAE